MIARALGGMQIANEKISVIEVAADWEHDAEFVRSWTPIYADIGEPSPYKRWAALSDSQSAVAIAELAELPDTKDTVLLWAFVGAEYRRVGLGRLMLRFGTDMAIRYRKRTIFAECRPDNAAAIKILEDEEFEKQPERNPGFVLFKKELKWV